MKTQIHSSDLKAIIKSMIADKFRLTQCFAGKNVIKDERIDNDYNSRNHVVLLGREFERISDSANFVISFMPMNLGRDFKMQQWRILRNPNGTIRYLFPAELKKPTFLSFYNVGSNRSKIIAGGIKLAFALGLQKMVARDSIFIYSKTTLKSSKIVNNVKHSSFSVFMGTKGENRTVLFELNDGKKSTHFVKVPTTLNGKTIVRNANKNMFDSRYYNFQRIKAPNSKLINGSILLTESMKEKRMKRVDSISTAHMLALEEMATFTVHENKKVNTRYFEAIDNKIESINESSKIEDTFHLKTLLKSIQINEEPTKFSMAHGDFTPWNMYVGKKKINVYDWELGATSKPMFYDLFHFIYQSETLLKRNGIKEIKKEIKRVFNHPIIHRLITKYSIDTEKYHRLYLLDVVSTNILMFEKQEELAVENQISLKVWNKAVKDFVPENFICRQTFIEMLNLELKNIPHVYMKAINVDIHNLPISSDLDILLQKQNLNRIIEFTQQFDFVKKVKQIKKSYMTTLEILFADNSFLSVDLLHTIKRKSINYLNPERLLKSRVENNLGMMVSDITSEFEYCFLFYTLNGVSIPEKYKTLYSDFSKVSYNDRLRVLNYISNKFQLPFLYFNDFFTYTEKTRDYLMFRLSSMNGNNGVSGVLNKILYAFDTLKSFRLNKGTIISFSGVDGAGKSSLIEKFKAIVESKFRKEVVLLRHRPGILPILSSIKYGKVKAEQKAAVELPRMGNNDSLISSLARFVYYFTDYIIGQFYVYFKYSLRGKIVIYDRYYFDFICDSKRSNIKLKESFIRQLYSAVFKPELNFFITAPTNVIYSRKQELSKKVIDDLSIKYETLFTELSDKYGAKKYKVIENLDIASSLKELTNSYIKAA